MNCWICGNPANSGEHLIKASDLRAHFGKVTQSKPIYYHAGKKKNIPVGTLKNARFKSKALICGKCNNALTQPYDKAWETLFCYLNENWQELKDIGVVNLSAVFDSTPRREMLKVHLFFLKHFGCRVQENNVPIDLTEIADSVRKCKPCKFLYLCIGETLGYDSDGKYAGVTEINALHRGSQLEFANWFYTVGKVSVQIIYSRVAIKYAKASNPWHPRMMERNLKLAKF